MEKPENLESREFLVDLVQWVHQEIRVQWEIKELRAHLESLARLVPEVILEKMGLQEFQVLLVKLDQLESEVLSVLLVLEDSKGCQDHQERMENQAEMELQECRDLQVIDHNHNKC